MPLPETLPTAKPCFVRQLNSIPTLRVRMRDSTQDETWDYSHTEDVELEAGRYMTIGFRAENGGFEYR